MSAERTAALRALAQHVEAARALIATERAQPATLKAGTGFSMARDILLSHVTMIDKQVTKFSVVRQRRTMGNGGGSRALTYAHTHTHTHPTSRTSDVMPVDVLFLLILCPCCPPLASPSCSTRSHALTLLVPRIVLNILRSPTHIPNIPPILPPPPLHHTRPRGCPR